ncbi:uncharacterized protein [Dysidea avara]|uniref:uncharacterized protein n=1 Tax=Dysidea avara TaxID=196820 RepID=UPI00332C521D
MNAMMRISFIILITSFLITLVTALTGFQKPGVALTCSSGPTNNIVSVTWSPVHEEHDSVEDISKSERFQYCIVEIDCENGYNEKVDQCRRGKVENQVYEWRSVPKSENFCSVTVKYRDFYDSDGTVLSTKKNCYFENPIVNVSVTPVNTTTLGQPLMLECTVVTWSGLHDSAEVVWMTNNNESRRITVQNVAKSSVNNLTMYTDNYNTSDITLQDNGDEFSCQVEFNIPSSVNYSNVFILNITVAPYNVNITGNITYPHGSQLQLHCSSEGGPQLEYSWSRTNTLSNDTTTNTNNLTISKVTALDGGNYTCTVTNDAGSSNNTVTVYVGPVFTTHPMNQEEVINNNFTLQCRAEGFPTPSMQWYLNNTMITNSSNRYIVDTTSMNSITSVLRVIMADVTDTGLYHCEANSSVFVDNVNSDMMNITVVEQTTTSTVTSTYTLVSVPPTTATSATPTVTDRMTSTTTGSILVITIVTSSTIIVIIVIAIIICGAIVLRNCNRETKQPSKKLPNWTTLADNDYYSVVGTDEPSICEDVEGISLSILYPKFTTDFEKVAYLHFVLKSSDPFIECQESSQGNFHEIVSPVISTGAYIHAEDSLGNLAHDNDDNHCNATEKGSTTGTASISENEGLVNQISNPQQKFQAMPEHFDETSTFDQTRNFLSEDSGDLVGQYIGEQSIRPLSANAILADHSFSLQQSPHPKSATGDYTFLNSNSKQSVLSDQELSMEQGLQPTLANGEYVHELTAMAQTFRSSNDEEHNDISKQNIRSTSATGEYTELSTSGKFISSSEQRLSQSSSNDTLSTHIPTSLQGLRPTLARGEYFDDLSTRTDLVSTKKFN